MTLVTDGAVSSAFGYDGLDRVTARNGTPFTYASAATDPVGVGGESFTWAAGGLVTVTASGTLSFPLVDRHGDLIARFAADGTVAGSASFDPYGEPTGVTGTTTVLGYQSDYTDPSTGHVWMAARWYQPSTATFLSRDTLLGEVQTPFSLNRYTYGVNNPIRFWDPSGHLAEGDSPSNCGTQSGRRASSGCREIPKSITDYHKKKKKKKKTESTWGAADAGSLMPPPSSMPVVVSAKALGPISVKANAASMVLADGFDVSATAVCSGPLSHLPVIGGVSPSFLCGAADNVVAVGQMVGEAGGAAVGCVAQRGCDGVREAGSSVVALNSALERCYHLGRCGDAFELGGTIVKGLYDECVRRYRSYGADDCAGYLAVDIADIALGSHGLKSAVGKTADVLDVIRRSDNGLIAPNTARKAPGLVEVPGEFKLPGVPKGADGVPTQTGKGLAYSIPSGTPELHPNVSGIPRVMDPVTTGKHQYPNGYVAYMNESGQTINPLSRQTISNSDPFAHIELP